jgi:hypothetical protein
MRSPVPGRMKVPFLSCCKKVTQHQYQDDNICNMQHHCTRSMRGGGELTPRFGSRKDFRPDGIAGPSGDDGELMVVVSWSWKQNDGDDGVCVQYVHDFC